VYAHDLSGKAETDAGPVFLRREKGDENFVHGILINAGAIVGNAQGGSAFRVKLGHKPDMSVFFPSSA